MLWILEILFFLVDVFTGTPLSAPIVSSKFGSGLEKMATFLRMSEMGRTQLIQTAGELQLPITQVLLVL